MPALLTLGGMGVALHYEKLSELFDGVPLIMAYGLPVSGKSLAAPDVYISDALKWHFARFCYKFLVLYAQKQLIFHHPSRKLLHT